MKTFPRSQDGKCQLGFCTRQAHKLLPPQKTQKTPGQPVFSLATETQRPRT